MRRSARKRPRRRRWVLYLLLVLAVPAVLAAGFLSYYSVTFSRQIAERLQGERVRVLPRVYARPLELRTGQALTEREVIDRLNDLGYTERGNAARPGEFARVRGSLALVPRTGPQAGRAVRVSFVTGADPGGAAASRVSALAIDGRASDRLTLDPPLLTAIFNGGREKRRQVPLATIPARMRQAVIAIEDRRFFDHPGVDPIRSAGAIVTNVFGDKPYLVGGSTITQQLVKNFFLTPEKSYRRKLLEQFMALLLERRASKEEILELYLNEVYLGQRGSFAIHGVAEAARLFFAKDVTNVSLAEAATIAGVIQSPGVWSPFGSPARCRERRNVVLRAMAEAGFISEAAAARAAAEPLNVVQRALEAQAPYFVDLVGQTVADDYPQLVSTTRSLEVYTTLDLHLQRLAQDAMHEGLVRVDEALARRKRRQRAQAAVIAVDPRTGEVLALVGGRSYNQSQFNRAVAARRQPGSVFKPFVYLAAFERAVEEVRADLTPASLVTDEPTAFDYAEGWTPGNYEDEYDGAITFRRALAMSRNIATIHVAEQAGFDKVAALWRRVGVGTQPHAYPSITLGVFEVTPFEIASAYTVFPGAGELKPLRVLQRLVSGGRDQAITPPAARRIARPETTFLVTNMMRSVINEGTGAGARAAGFALDAAGKSGTTNDLRDAWFVGFTPELLTVVWVGLDDNQPLGLSGTQAAVPIWTAFMKRALAGQPDRPFEPPQGIAWVEIDRDTGRRAEPTCPRVIREAFIAGTEPLDACDLHRF